MRRFCFAVFICTASPALAETCPTFALNGDYLNGFFCGQLDQITGPRTRTIEPQDPVTTTDDALSEWLALPSVAEAYRVDPARTLELIQRIKDAGGAPLQ